MKLKISEPVNGRVTVSISPSKDPSITYDFEMDEFDQNGTIYGFPVLEELERICQFEANIKYALDVEGYRMMPEAVDCDFYEIEGGLVVCTWEFEDGSYRSVVLPEIDDDDEGNFYLPLMHPDEKLKYPIDA